METPNLYGRHLIEALTVGSHRELDALLSLMQPAFGRRSHANLADARAHHSDALAAVAILALLRNLDTQ